jgi:hypothetical protein
MAMSRRMRDDARVQLAGDLRSRLPRVALDAATPWEADRRSIERRVAADRCLAEHRFDRWRRPVGRPRGGDDA